MFACTCHLFHAHAHAGSAHPDRSVCCCKVQFRHLVVLTRFFARLSLPAPGLPSDSERGARDDRGSSGHMVLL